MLNSERSNKIPLVLLGWIICVSIAAGISPLDRYDWLMENILVFTFLIGVIFAYKKSPLSNFSYVLVTIFLTLHLIGAHYTYSEVPLGFYLDKNFGFGRNHYDRVVHFFFGFLIVYPIREILTRANVIKGFWKFILPIAVTFSCSGIFELIEWLFVTMVHPTLGSAYLGTQGDIWDAQKDIALALMGAVISMLITFGLRKITTRHIF